MSTPPKTVLSTSSAEEAAIRAAVRHANVEPFGWLLAEPRHAEELTEILSDPAVSDPISDLPRPITLPNVRAWIADCEARRLAGECLFLLSLDEAGAIAGFGFVDVWPDRSAAEYGGGLRSDLQNSGRGRSDAGWFFGWMFETLGVRLICLTAALDNFRSAKLIDKSGFVRMGERDCVRTDGVVRRSLYWEMSRETWRGLGGESLPPGGARLDGRPSGS